MPIDMEESITFDCQGILLEGRLNIGPTGKGALITHPHPLFGGDMNNQVVVALAQTYQAKGWSTLRFNFRGTGGSQGRFDNGRSEQFDIDAAIACLETRGCRHIDLAGYSYGAWVLALWAQNQPGHPHAIRLVAPPVAFMDFNGIQSIPGLDQVVAGGADEIAPYDQIEALMPVWRPEAEFNVIRRADHFFGRYLPDLRAAVDQRIE